MIQAEMQKVQVDQHAFSKSRCYFASLLHFDWTERSEFFLRITESEMIVEPCHWIITANAAAKKKATSFCPLRREGFLKLCRVNEQKKKNDTTCTRWWVLVYIKDPRRGSRSTFSRALAGLHWPPVRSNEGSRNKTRRDQRAVWLHKPVASCNLK